MYAGRVLADLFREQSFCLGHLARERPPEQGEWIEGAGRLIIASGGRPTLRVPLESGVNSCPTASCVESLDRGGGRLSAT